MSEVKTEEEAVSGAKVTVTNGGLEQDLVYKVEETVECRSLCIRVGRRAEKSRPAFII